MRKIELHIFEYEDQFSGDVLYKVEFSSCVDFRANRDGFVSLSEAIRYRDSEIDKKNIKKVELRDGQIRFRTEVYQDGKKIRKTFETFADAVQYRQQKRIEKEVGKVSLGKKMTFEEFSGYWLQNEVLALRTKTTYDLYCRMLNTHILDDLKNIKIQGLKAHHINELVSTLRRKNLANKTISLCLSVIQRCLEFALINDVVSRNIMRTIDKVSGQEQEPEYWELEDLKKFFKYMEGKSCFILYFLAFKTGMRKGECAGLKWNAVNFNTGMIRISHTRTNNDFKSETKSKKVRFIPMTDDISKLLKNLKEKRNPKGNDFVFLTYRNLPYSYNSMNTMFHEYQEKAKVSKKIPFHGLRHTFSSHFAMEGGKLELLQQILGHSNFRMTERYKHFNEDYLKSAKDIIDKTEI